MKSLIIDKFNDIIRLAVTNDNELFEYYVEKDSKNKIVGNIYKGKIERVHRSMEVAFLNIGLEKNAFLFIGDNIDINSPIDKEIGIVSNNLKHSQGDYIMCQIIKDQFGNKGPRVTLDITLPGRLLVMLPYNEYLGVSNKIVDEERKEKLNSILKNAETKNHGFIIRTAAEFSSDKEIEDEIKSLIEKWDNILKSYKNAQSQLVFSESDLLSRALRDMLIGDIDKIIVNDKNFYDRLQSTKYSNNIILESQKVNLFEKYNLQKEIDKLNNKKVVLENGGNIIIDKTEALTVIDVNTSRYTGIKNSCLEDTVLETNIVAVKEIARQLRLRNIGGIIIVDFIDMKLEENREKVLKVFEDELKKDRIKTSLEGMTNLGLVELTRKKMRRSLSQFNHQKCFNCENTGFIKSNEKLIFELRAELNDLLGEIKTNNIKVSANSNFVEFCKSTNYVKEIESLYKLKIIFEQKNDIKDYLISF